MKIHAVHVVHTLNHRDRSLFPSVTRIARYCATHPWRILTFAFIVSLLAGVGAAHLPVHTSRQALLPQDTEVAHRFNAFLEKFGAASDLQVVLEGAPRNVQEHFATELATRLRGEPEVASVTERIDPSLFLNRAYLLAPLDRLVSLETLLENADDLPSLSEALRLAQTELDEKPSPRQFDMNTLRSGLSALAGVLEEWQRWLTAPEVPTDLDWARLATTVGASDLGNGYFSSRDGRLLLLFVHPRNAATSFEVLQPLNEKVRSVSEKLAAEYRTAGRPAPSVVLTGLPAIEYEEYVDIERDIRLVIFTAAGLIAALILLVVRSLRWALAIFVPMGLGAAWSLGLALFTVGHLTIITSSFLAILFGLGADYGIFTTSRIAEERRHGKPLIDAIALGIGSSFPALLTAGGASLLIFGALATVDFPGFAELGRVAAGGVLLILLATWFVQPALYALFPPKPRVVTTPSKPERSRQSRGRYPAVAALILVTLAVISATLGIRSGLNIPFDYDVLSLLPANSEAAHYQRRLTHETDYQSEVVIFTADTLDEARRITEQAGKLKSLAKVQSIVNLFPPDAVERLAVGRQIGLAATSSQFEQGLSALDKAGLDQAELNQLQTLLKTSLEKIDDGMEQAFSMGHADLLQPLEQVRSRIETLLNFIEQHPEQALDRSERFYRQVLSAAQAGLSNLKNWKDAQPLTPETLPQTLRDRFFSQTGEIAIYAFPAHSVYDPEFLDRLVREVYSVSPLATGFPTTHQVFSKAVVNSFSQGTLLATGVCLAWLIIVIRNLRGIILACVPLVIGGGWMLGLMAIGGLRYNYANIIALPLVIALAVDYGVWYGHRWQELKGCCPLQVTLNAGKVIALAAGTELAGLGAITLASYRGVSSLGVDITIGLLCCLLATFLIAPAVGQLFDTMRKS